MAEPKGPLSGVRVLDLTRVLVGPYCTKLLGDMGAEVIKIEDQAGDITRSFGPQRNPGMSANFLIFNRNKRSVVLDLKQAAGQDALSRIAATCDAFVVNYRPAALSRLRITYSDISAVNPSIVYCRIVGFGPGHPDSLKPAMDDIIQSLTGLVDLQGQLTGTPGFVGLPLADLVCGLFSLSGILAALYRRQQTGKGEEVEVRMYDAMANFVLSPHLAGWSFEPPISDPVYPRSVSPNRRPLETRDGVICICPYSDRDWRRFLDVIGRADLLADERFKATYVRNQNLDALYEIITPEVRKRSSAQWLQLLGELDIAASPIRTTRDLVTDPGLLEDNVLSLHDHPTEGRLRLLGSPVRFTESGTQDSVMPPLLGADTNDVLREVGFTEAELEELDRSGVTSTTLPDR
jgi:crotonobetainyl-CoA:carnitine CoA-transferase CaiB-like acyl-CoA transferase